MNRRRLVIAASVVLLVVSGGAVARHQVNVYKNRQIRAEEHRVRAAQQHARQALFALVQPVALANCRLERFGEDHDAAI